MVGDAKKQNKALIAAVCISGPGIVTLVPMAAAPAMPALARAFSTQGDGMLFAQSIMTVPAIAMVLAAPLTGYLSERFGRKLVLLASLIVYVLGGAGAIYVNDANALIAARLVLGVAAGGVLTCSLAMIGDYFEGPARERVLGFSVAMASLVAAFSLNLGGWMVDAGGWRGPFHLYYFGLLVFFAALVALPRVSVRVLDEPLVKWRPMIRLWPFYALLLVLTIGMFIPSIQGPFLVESDGETSAAVQGAIVSACSVVAIVSAASYGYLRSFFSVRLMYAIIALSYAIGATLMFALHGVLIAVGAAAIGIGAGLAEATTASALLARSPAAVHGRAMGLMVSALFMGQWLNPWAFDPLREAFGLRGSFLAAALGFLVLGAALLLWRGGRAVSPATASQA